MGIFGNSFGVSKKLDITTFIKELDESAAIKLAKVYSNEPIKVKLCSEITGLPESRTMEVLKVASLIVMSQLSLAFPNSKKGLSKSDLIARQEAVLVMANKLPDLQFMYSLLMIMKTQQLSYFDNNPELKPLAQELFAIYSSGQSIYQDYFLSHFE